MIAQHRAPEGQSQDQTLGALVHQLTQQLPELIRSEMRLAQAEVAEAGPPAPERAIQGLKEDIATVKGDHQ